MRLYHGTDAHAAAAIEAAGALAVTDPAGNRSYVTDQHGLALDYAVRSVARAMHHDDEAPADGAVVVLTGELGRDARPDALCAPHEFLVLQPMPVEKIVTVDVSAARVVRDPVMRRLASLTGRWAQESTCNGCGRVVSEPGPCSARCRDEIARATPDHDATTSRETR